MQNTTCISAGQTKRSDRSRKTRGEQAVFSRRRFLRAGLGGGGALLLAACAPSPPPSPAAPPPAPTSGPAPTAAPAVATTAPAAKTAAPSGMLSIGVPNEPSTMDPM